MNAAGSALASARMDGAAAPIAGLAPSSAPIQEERLLMALLSEVEVLSVFVVVSASLANALRQPLATKVNREALISYLPPDQTVYAGAAVELLRINGTSEVLSALQIFNARLALAKRMSQAYITETTTSAAQRSVIRDTLADAWQRACGSAIGAAQCLRQVIFDLSEGRQRPRPNRVNDLLKAAQRGEHPCVQPDGSVVVPGWAERRRARRQQLDISCLVHHGGVTNSAIIQDLSTGGTGLAGIADAVRGEPATVEMPGGRRLTGVVSWTSGDRLGVKFDVQLSHEDPLLADDVIDPTP